MINMSLARKLLDSRPSAMFRGIARRGADTDWRDRGARFGAGLRVNLQAEGPQPQSDLESYFESHTEGRGIWKWRHYFPMYDRHLQPFRGRAVRLLEIGVFSGGSLEMWRTYLGVNATIIGLDIEEACRIYEGPGIEIIIGDQSDPAFWADFLGKQAPFDIVIDDGGHQIHQQVATIEAVLPHMAPGGVYVCEDVHHEQNSFAAYIAGLATNLHAADSIEKGVRLGLPASPFQQAVQSIHIYPYVVVVERRSHKLDELVCPMHGTVWNPHWFDQNPQFFEQNPPVEDGSDGDAG